MTSKASRGPVEGRRDWEAAPLSAVLHAAAPPGASKRARAVKRLAWSLLPPATFAAMIGLWSASVAVFKIPAYLLPGPAAVFSRVVTDAGMLWQHSLVTLTEIVLGFALTVLTAIP